MPYLIFLLIFSFYLPEPLQAADAPGTGSRDYEANSAIIPPYKADADADADADEATDEATDETIEIPESIRTDLLKEMKDELIGLKVIKEFEGIKYIGKIIGIKPPDDDSHDFWYTILYEDGDSEDLKPKKVCKILQRDESCQSPDSEKPFLRLCTKARACMKEHGHPYRCKRVFVKKKRNSGLPKRKKGETETTQGNMPAPNSRKRQRTAPDRFQASPARSSICLKPGDRIETPWTMSDGSNKWFAGTVTEIKKDGSCLVLHDDGDLASFDFLEEPFRRLSRKS